MQFLGCTDVNIQTKPVHGEPLKVPKIHAFRFDSGRDSAARAAEKNSFINPELLGSSILSGGGTTCIVTV